MMLMIAMIMINLRFCWWYDYYGLGDDDDDNGLDDVDDDKHIIVLSKCILNLFSIY